MSDVVILNKIKYKYRNKLDHKRDICHIHYFIFNKNNARQFILESSYGNLKSF